MPTLFSPDKQNADLFSHGKKLDSAFFAADDVLAISRRLMGKILVTRFNGELTAGRIVEAEAYKGIRDKASHAYGGRRTNRTEIMYGPGGTAYVYLCYGIHQMFNIVTNTRDIPDAILIRALEPIAGVDTMLRRTGKQKPDFSITRGPGNVAKALGLSTRNTGDSVCSDLIFIWDDLLPLSGNIKITPRIGVAYAEEDAALPYRFIIADNAYISGNRKQNNPDRI